MRQVISKLTVSLGFTLVPGCWFDGFEICAAEVYREVARNKHEGKQGQHESHRYPQSPILRSKGKIWLILKKAVKCFAIFYYSTYYSGDIP